MTYEWRDIPKLRNAANGAPCMHCGAMNGTVVAAHANWIELGKGMGIKAPDCMVSFLCHRCHQRLDAGNDLSKQQKKDMWLMAYAKTMLYCFRNGIVGAL